MINIQSRLNHTFAREKTNIPKKGDVCLIQLEDVPDLDKKWLKTTANIDAIYRDGRKLNCHHPLVFFAKQGKRKLKAGDILLIANEVMPIRNMGNPGEFDSEAFWNRKGYFFQCFAEETEWKLLKEGVAGSFYTFINELRLYLKRQLTTHLEGEELAIALALILGDKSLIDPEISSNFTNTGAMHVLAVSGLHIGLIMQFLLLVLGQFSRWITRNQAIVTVLVLMWLYALITGFSPSVLRAVFMFSVLVSSQLLSRAQDQVNTLFFTGFALVLWDPFLFFDIGFQLSFLAMLGIYLFYRPIEQAWFISQPIARQVWQGTAIGFAAQIMTTPLSLHYFHQFPNYFILSNIGLMATSGVVLALGMILFASGWLWWLAKWIGMALTLSVFLSYAVVVWVAGLPGAVAYGFDVPLWMVAFFACMSILLFQPALSAYMRMGCYALLLSSLCYLAFGRYRQMSIDEIRFFNARQTILCVKKDQRIFCFYRCRTGDFEKVRNIMTNYAKVYPGEVSYFDMDKRNWQLRWRGFSFQTEKWKGTYRIKLNKRKFELVYSNFADPDSSFETIAMPWVHKISGKNLSQGSVRYPY